MKFHHGKTYLRLNKFTILPRGSSLVIYTVNGSVGWQQEQTIHWIKYPDTCKAISFHIKWKLVVFYSSVFNIVNHHQPRDQKFQGQEQGPTFRVQSSEWPFKGNSHFSLVPLGLWSYTVFSTVKHFVTLQINRLNNSSVKQNQVLQVEMLLFLLRVLHLWKLKLENWKLTQELVWLCHLPDWVNRKINLHLLVVT